MVQQIVTWCDRHLEKGEQVLGTTWSLTISPPSAKPYVFEQDLCSDCAEPYEGLIADLMETARQVSGAKRPPSAAVPTPSAGKSVGAGTGSGVQCPFCEVTPTSSGALDSHLRKHHDTSLAEHEGRAKQPCPVPECSRKLVNAVGIAAHLRITHPEWLAEHPEHQPQAAQAR